MDREPIMLFVRRVSCSRTHLDERGSIWDRDECDPVRVFCSDYHESEIDVRVVSV